MSHRATAPRRPWRCALLWFLVSVVLVVGVAALVVYLGIRFPTLPFLGAGDEPGSGFPSIIDVRPSP